jgi:hypothetical protein
MKTVTFKRNLTIGLLILFIGVLGAPSKGLANLNDGLMGYWKFDECSGNTVHDSSGHGYDGTIYGGAWVNGISGCALEFVDTEMVRSIPSSFDDSIDTALTIIAWVKWYGPNSYNRGSVIFDGRNSGATGGFAFYLGIDGTLEFHMHQAGSGIQSICHVPADTAIWTHVAAVFDDNSDALRLFINGKQVKMLTTTVHYLKSSLTAAMGNDRWAPGDHQWAPLNGVLDEVRLYNRALSEAEIQMLYNPGSGSVAYWNFNEGSGDTLHDYSGHNNHGVISGATWTSGESSSALEIVGTDIVQNIPSSLDDSITTALTVSAWVKWYGTSPYPHGCVIFDNRQDPGMGFVIAIDYSSRKLIFHMNQGSGSGIESTHLIPADSSWTHVAVVFDDNSNTLSTFINGCHDNDSITTFSYHNSSDQPAIGNNHWAPGDHQWAPLNGIVDEVRIYKRALSNAEIQLLSCSYIHRGDCTGDEVIDASDVVYLLNYLFAGGPPPDPLAAGDCNCDFVVDISDVVWLLNYLFHGGPPPCSCTNTPMWAAGLQQSLNKDAKTATVGFGRVEKLKDGYFEIPLEGEVDMDVVGLQFENSYDPKEVTLLKPELTPRTEGLQIFSSAQDGIQKIGLVDLSGQNYITPGKPPLIILKGKGSDASSIKIREAVLVDREANKIPVKIVGEMNKGEEGSEVKESFVPKDFSLLQNLPNPFNPQTEISYDLPNACHVKLSIYNLLGQRLRTLVDEYQTTGHKTVLWDSKDDRGNRVASGIYFYQIQAGNFTDAKKMILMK